MYIKKLLLTLLLLLLPFSFPCVALGEDMFEDNFESGQILDKWPYISGTWSKENFNNSVWSRVSSGGYSDNLLEIDNSSWIDYIFKIDIFKIEGEDINLFFRTQNSRYLNLPGHNLPAAYGLHMQHNRIALQKFTSTTGTELQIVSEGFPFLNSTLKHVEIKVLNNNIQIFIDGNINPIIDYTDNNDPFLNGGIAIGSITGSSGQGVRFDNILVLKLPEHIQTPEPTVAPTESPTTIPSPTSIPTPEPTTSPTGSPTASPTSTPSPSPTTVSLIVPNLKQYSLPWKNKLYAFTKNTIQEYGCALTSAAMVLQYHGHNITPDTLNDWLKNQSDGYLRGNLINWLAVSRYTKQHDSTSSPTLEYKRLDPTNENLSNELNNNRPAILKENGHFVVAKSILPNTFGINDPGYSNRNDLNPYGNSFLAINSYTPTHSNLSYVMFVIDSNVILDLFNSTGTKISAISYVEEPIKNLLNQRQTLGKPVKIVLFEKPSNGKYSIKVSGKGNYQLDSYLYDISGKVTQNKFEGKLKGGDTDKLLINYSNETKKLNHKHWLFELWKHFRERD